MLVGFSSLPHELELLEGNVHDQDAPPNGELAKSSLKAARDVNYSSFSIGS
jgi:hypothetical protein